MKGETGIRNDSTGVWMDDGYGLTGRVEKMLDEMNDDTDRHWTRLTTALDGQNDDDACRNWTDRIMMMHNGTGRTDL